MLYANTTLIWPTSKNDPNSMIPKTADLRGINYYYRAKHLITYNATDSKFLCIKDTSGYIYRSIFQQGLDGDIIDTCIIGDLIYVLSYMGMGKLSIYQGSLQSGYDDGIISFIEYQLPFYTPSIANTNGETFLTDGQMRYLCYHPRYCSIFNKGTDLMLLLGLRPYSNNMDSIENLGYNPNPVMCQYIVNYDLIGIFKGYTRVDDFVSTQSPYIDLLDKTKLNGLHITGFYHDGIITLLGENLGSAPNQYAGALKVLKFNTTVNDTSNMHGLSYNTTYTIHSLIPFIAGPYRNYDSITSYGRKFCALINNKIFIGNILMLDIYSYRIGEIYSTTIDLGTVSSNSLVRKYIRIANKSPQYNYNNLRIISGDSNLNLALVDTTTHTPISPFAESIQVTNTLCVGDYVDICIQFQTGVLTENMCEYYTSKLTFTASTEML